MNKAFVFDMDGVLVDSESAWQQFEEPFYGKIFGPEILSKVSFGPGIGIDGVYESAVAAGAKFDAEEFTRGFEAIAMQVYDVAPLTQGVDELVNALARKQFKLGIVTNSPQTWVDRVVPRLACKDTLDIVLSIKECPHLRHKPAPDGYLEAFRLLGADPTCSFVLEDSNFGIQAAKASGAFTIGYSGNLVEGYHQTGADAYADSMEEVLTIVTKLSSDT